MHWELEFLKVAVLLINFGLGAQGETYILNY